LEGRWDAVNHDISGGSVRGAITEVSPLWTRETL
jgi:hypothetical protein